MKKFFAGMITVPFLAGMAMADPALGLWKTQPDDGYYAHIRMAKCGSKVCGTIEKSFKGGKEVQTKNTGKRMVHDMKPNGDGSYNGRVWRPSNGKMYTGKMSVSGSKLVLKGCVAGGLICSGQTWTRIK